MLSDRFIAQYRPSFVLPALGASFMLGITFGIYTFLGFASAIALPAAVLIGTFFYFIYRRQFSWDLMDERLIQRSGIFVRDTTVIRLERITDIRVRIPLLASLLGTASVQVSTAGNDGYQMAVFGQHRARNIEAQVARAKRAYQARVGVPPTPTP